ncbi:hypothetical protein IHC87_06705 [Photobacterium damselae subsp. damselae]|uniref:hypothetical protein n=1 Tax=Photobacterium damselae TaxID=38293 RepID=UPI001F4384D9|nr:hypothetical protein [Photobacterium damselae]UJZ95029.1 hypothetical protein IHC87_06705 [Photobacterium damselae subsp. damselae]UJZ99010.1 hypothetical protein IHC88_06695 [Photobacterium damselae subsp. damselae]
MKKIILIIFMIVSHGAYAKSNDIETMNSIFKGLVSSRLFYEHCYQGKEQYKDEFSTIDDENRFYMTKLISTIEGQVDWFKTKAKWANRGDFPNLQIAAKYETKLNMNIGLLRVFINPSEPNSVIIRNGLNSLKLIMNKDNFKGLIAAQGGCDNRLESYKRMEKESSEIFPKPW